MPRDEYDEQGNPIAPAPPAKDAKEETVTLTKAELESLRRERDEARESERAWAKIARQPSRPAEEQAEEPDETLNTERYTAVEAGDAPPAGDTPAQLVDDFTAEGLSALYKRGIPTKADVKKMIVDVAVPLAKELVTRERAKATTDAEIMDEFPELKDENSPLFKETGKIYSQAVKMDPNLRKTPAALFLAARAAKASLPASSRPARTEEDDDREGDRLARVSAQDSRPSGRAAAVDDDMLGPEAQSIIRSFGITEQEFRDSRQQLGGGRPRGRR